MKIEKKEEENSSGNLPQYLKELNERQRDAVVTTDGPLLILAGAGAGKTKTITHRILHLIKNGVPGRKILAITFTNKSAKEMKERLHKILQKDPELNFPVSIENASIPFVSTFHSLGVHILKENSVRLGMPRHFTIFDRNDSKSAVKEAMERRGVDPKRFEPSKMLSIISREKGNGVSFGEFLNKGADSHMAMMARDIWEEYEVILKKEKAYDFDDLLLKAYELLKIPEVLETFQNKWSHIHIDEYQDTNRVQYEMAKLLAMKERNIAVVGDIDQCLVAGTEITMSNGERKNIEQIKTKELVMSNYGSGDFRPAKISRVISKNYTGELISITTTKGRKLTSTKNHIHFASFNLGISSQKHFTYLMYKKNQGYRLGVSQVYTSGQKKSLVGFIQRSNQEHSDKTWVIKTHDTKNEALALEYRISLKFCIPTLPFVARKTRSNIGLVCNQDYIDNIFKEFQNDKKIDDLFKEYSLEKEYPHHFPQSKDSKRNNITITLCGDRRGQNPMHRISMTGNSEETKTKLKKGGFSMRAAKKDSLSWRLETCRTNYKEILQIVEQIQSLIGNCNIIENARLGGKKQNTKDGNSLKLLPASALREGMVLFGEEGEYDVIEKIEKTIQKITVYDLDIEKTHNYIANGIITHNSIYSWRGADYKNILRFEKDYPESKTVLLEENYRSTKTIIEVSNKIIEKNTLRKEKVLFTNNEDGDQISLYCGFDEKDEADYIARTSQMLIRQGVNPSEIAILYRANFQSRSLEESFIKKNIPYNLLGTKFFDRKEIKDCLAYLKCALNPDSMSEFKRAISSPPRGIGKTTILKILEGKEDDLPRGTKEKIESFRNLLQKIKELALSEKPSETIKKIISLSGLELSLQTGLEEDLERLENIRELVTTASSYDHFLPEEGIEKFLENVSLASDQDDLKEEKEAVRFMTVHASKGLEFDYCFITGLEEDLFPHTGLRDSPKNTESREEERRLFYVALTRARKKIYLTYTQMRTIFGSRKSNIPSEFILDIDEEFLERENGTGNAGREKIVYLEF